jgi:hypothetical protein
METEEEEEMKQLKCKKITLLMFPQLPEQAMLIGKDVNEIISIAFITDPVDKNLRLGISPNQGSEPPTPIIRQPLHSLNGQDDPEADTHISTIIT